MADVLNEGFISTKVSKRHHLTSAFEFVVI